MQYTCTIAMWRIDLVKCMVSVCCPSHPLSDHDIDPHTLNLGPLALDNLYRRIGIEVISLNSGPLFKGLESNASLIRLSSSNPPFTLYFSWLSRRPLLLSSPFFRLIIFHNRSLDFQAQLLEVKPKCDAFTDGEIMTANPSHPVFVT